MSGVLTFEPFSLESLKKVIPCIQKSSLLCSDISAGYLFMWNAHTKVHFCVWEETLVVREMIGEQPAFSYPVGANPDGMLEGLKAYVLENHFPLRFFAIDEPLLEAMQQDKRFPSVMGNYDRKWSDYLYSFEEIRDLRGRKYNTQRNHINKFKKLYGDPYVRFLTKEDLPLITQMLCDYEKEHSDAKRLEKRELEQTRKLFEVFEELGLYAAGLFVEEELVAVTIGEVVGEMLLVHVEKALRTIEGAYPTMFVSFVRLMDSQRSGTLRYINREDDSGDEGLRISKMRYHPIKLVNKHVVHVDSFTKQWDPSLVLAQGDIVLTQIRESDKKAYKELNMDVENNRYWGYDYRKDLSWLGEITDDTFYNSVQFDMSLGDSINFAIRQTKEGPMIGEVILWNFTAERFLEIGCRLFPEYHQKGYGKTAFGLAADYAEQTLGAHAIAKCFHENISSYRMIEGNGFVLSKKDDTYYYFERKCNR
ncbi:MAG: GNAT family N-acetyltransferase [Clostridia bacterium]|nr:GNAT family N-acetyltransferase [Clostridia bacterium]